MKALAIAVMMGVLLAASSIACAQEEPPADPSKAAADAVYEKLSAELGARLNGEAPPLAKVRYHLAFLIDSSHFTGNSTLWRFVDGFERAFVRRLIEDQEKRGAKREDANAISLYTYQLDLYRKESRLDLTPLGSETDRLLHESLTRSTFDYRPSGPDRPTPTPYVVGTPSVIGEGHDNSGPRAEVLDLLTQAPGFSENAILIQVTPNTGNDAGRDPALKARLLRPEYNTPTYGLKGTPFDFYGIESGVTTPSTGGRFGYQVSFLIYGPKQPIPLASTRPTNSATPPASTTKQEESNSMPYVIGGGVLFLLLTAGGLGYYYTRTISIEIDGVPRSVTRTQPVRIYGASSARLPNGSLVLNGQNGQLPKGELAVIEYKSDVTIRGKLCKLSVNGSDKKVVVLRPKRPQTILLKDGKNNDAQITIELV